MKKVVSLFIITVLLFSTALPLSAKSFKYPMPFELRAMQTHIFPTNDTQQVFKATINTLQDNGFAIENVEGELGYIYARKEFKQKMTDKRRVTKDSFIVVGCLALTAATYGAFAPYLGFPIKAIQNETAPKTIITDVNASVLPDENGTKVRITMIEKVLENADGYSRLKSSPRKVIRIYNPLVYQEFFNELGKSIFYENI